MIQKLVQRVLPLIARIGSDPNDEDDIRLQKSLLVVCAIPFIFAGAAWGIMYILFNEPLAALWQCAKQYYRNIGEQRYNK